MQRALMIGLSHEISSEMGIDWNGVYDFLSIA